MIRMICLWHLYLWCVISVICGSGTFSISDIHFDPDHTSSFSFLPRRPFFPPCLFGQHVSITDQGAIHHRQVGCRHGHPPNPRPPPNRIPLHPPPQNRHHRLHHRPLRNPKPPRRIPCPQPLSLPPKPNPRSLCLQIPRHTPPKVAKRDPDELCVGMGSYRHCDCGVKVVDVVEGWDQVGEYT